MRDNPSKKLVNLAMIYWDFVNAIFLALTVPKFRRCTAQSVCIISLTLVFIGWTIASARYTGSQEVLAFIFLYSLAYDLAFTAYSAYHKLASAKRTHG